MQINDAIDNLRVVCCHDEDMTSGNPTSFDFQPTNEFVNTDIVQANMDEMAKALADKGPASDAWAAILRKPSGKDWSDVRAAIKVNSINSRNCTRVAIVDKMCKVLMDLGVPAGSIHIYDGKPFGGNNQASAQFGTSWGRSQLPDGVDIRDDLGGKQSVSYPHGKTYETAKWLADGTIDILINIAVAKGHTSSFWVGHGTLTMKNNIGSIKFSCPGGYTSPPYGVCDLAGMYKGDPICGGDPPRQQLAIVDALWANPSDHMAAPSHRPNRIVMGTFGGAVDYSTMHGLWNEMGGSYRDDVVDGMLTQFGIGTGEIGDLIDVTPASEAVAASYAGVGTPERIVTVRVDAMGHAVSYSKLSLAAGEKPFSARIIDMKGRLVRRIPVSSHIAGHLVRWDGRNELGKPSAPGTYAVVLKTDKTVRSGRISLGR